MLLEKQKRWVKASALMGRVICMVAKKKNTLKTRKTNDIVEPIFDQKMTTSTYIYGYDHQRMRIPILLLVQMHKIPRRSGPTYPYYEHGWTT